MVVVRYRYEKIPELEKVQALVFTFSVLSLLTLGSCRKLVETSPPSTTINSGNVYNGDATAIAAVTNLYVEMSRQTLPGGGITSLNFFPSLSSDELSLYNGATNNSVLYYYRNALSSTNINDPDFWTVFYQNIYAVNEAVEQLNLTNKLTASVKNQLLGEVKFIRAFCYFYLVNLYGDVPLTITTDYKVNATLSRSSKDQVYQQIVSDLKDAQGLLSAKFLNASLSGETIERVRPTRWAATALLSRVYLFIKDYADSENEATTLINSSSLFSLTTLDSTFHKNSVEAIWQLQPVNTGWNTEDARIFIIPSSGPTASIHPVYLSSQLVNSFEPGDNRKTKWAGLSNSYYYPFKYKSASYGDPVTEYETVLRLGEQYLIRAEARVWQDKFGEAKDDLNTVRIRAGLSTTGADGKSSLLNAIQHERQVELFTEWGHRWLDLKRTGTVDGVMNVVASQKGGSWSSNWQYYPISTKELLLNPNLTQTPGY